MLSSEPGEAAKVRNLGFTLPPNGGKEAGKPRQKLRLASGRTLLPAWKRKSLLLLFALELLICFDSWESVFHRFGRNWMFLSLEQVFGMVNSCWNMFAVALEIG